MEGPPVIGWHLHLCRWSRVSVGVPQSFLSNRLIKTNLPVLRNFIIDDPLRPPGILCSLIRNLLATKILQNRLEFALGLLLADHKFAVNHKNGVSPVELAMLLWISSHACQSNSNLIQAAL